MGPSSFPPSCTAVALGNYIPSTRDFHFSKEYRVTHLRPQHLLLTPVECRPIQHTYQAQVCHGVAVSRHQRIWKRVCYSWSVNAGYDLLQPPDYPHWVQSHRQAQVCQQRHATIHLSLFIFRFRILFLASHMSILHQEILHQQRLQSRSTII